MLGVELGDAGREAVLQSIVLFGLARFVVYCIDFKCK